MSEVRQGWPTFTVGYGSSFADDELTASSETAAHFGAAHTRVELDVRTFDESLGGVVSQLEEPVATASTVPMYFLCRRAKQDVTVALSGQGPDELFGGYKRHLGVRYGGFWARLPAWMRTGAGELIQRLPRNETLKRGLRSLHFGDRMKRYQAVLSLTTHDEVSSLFRPDVLPKGDPEAGITAWKDLQSLMAGTDDLGGLQFLEVRSTLPDELLMYTDKMSMAHGLEVRVPFLDLDVVEFVEQLPATLKVRWGVGKWLHRKVCTQHLPASVIRRRKHGFAVNVVDNWLRKSLSRQMEDIFNSNDARMYHILRRDAVLRMLAHHQSGRHDRHKLLFSLVVLEHWLREQENSVRTRAASLPSLVSSLAS
jgi:asparagine synthase (glutamine-hydrolysing)